MYRFEKKLLIVFVIIVFLFVPCLAEKLKIITTTTQIGTIAKQIGGKKVIITTIVPGSMCPGHFDIDPKTAREFLAADLLIRHIWDDNIQYAVKNIIPKNLPREIIPIHGSFMVPDRNIIAANYIYDIIIKYDNENTGYYKKNLNLYKGEIIDKNKEILVESEVFKGKKTIVSNHQADFVRYLGFDIVGEFTTADDMSIKGLKKILELGKKHKIDIVIDNLQSKSKVGRQIADDLGKKHVVLTNFPLQDSYLDAINHNLKKLSDKIK